MFFAPHYLADLLLITAGAATAALWAVGLWLILGGRS